MQTWKKAFSPFYIGMALQYGNYGNWSKCSNGADWHAM